MVYTHSNHKKFLSFIFTAILMGRDNISVTYIFMRIQAFGTVYFFKSNSFAQVIKSFFKKIIRKRINYD